MIRSAMMQLKTSALSRCRALWAQSLKNCQPVCGSPEPLVLWQRMAGSKMLELRELVYGTLELVELPLTMPSEL